MKHSHLFVLIVVLAIATSTSGQMIDADNAVRQYADNSWTERALKIGRVQKEIRSLRDTATRDRARRSYLVDRLGFSPQEARRRSREESRERAKKIESLERHIEDLENPLVAYYPDLPSLYHARPGDIGWLRKTVKIFQIVDAENVLVEYDPLYGQLVYPGTPEPKPRLFWLRTDARGMIDGQEMQIVGVFWSLVRALTPH